MNKYEIVAITFLLITIGFILNSFFREAISFINFVHFWSLLASIGTIVATAVAVKTMNAWKGQLRTTDEYKNDLIKINGIHKIHNMVLTFIDYDVPEFTDLWNSVMYLDMKKLTPDDDFFINDILGRMKNFRTDFVNSEIHHLKLSGIINDSLYSIEINPFGLNESEKEILDKYSDLVNLISRLVFRNTHMYAMRGQSYEPKTITHKGIVFSIFDLDEKLRSQLINEYKCIINSYNEKWKSK